MAARPPPCARSAPTTNDAFHDRAWSTTGVSPPLERVKVTAGENPLAALYSLIATCEVNGVNPVEYIADVLMRVQTHLASRIDELLPHNWSPPRPEPSA